MTTERAAMARTYTYCDWAVFPLWWIADGRCACPDTNCKSPGKHPITRNGVKDASGDPDVVAGWWERWPHAHVGLPVGANGLAVLDVDPGHGGDASFMKLTAAMAEIGEPMPNTLTQITGSSGVHYVFDAPDGGVKNVSSAFGPDLPGLDTRGRGGYIVVAPSGHVSGGVYEWVNFFAGTAPWPDVLTSLMNWRPERCGHVATKSRDLFANPLDPFGGAGYGEAALRGELERIRQAGEGTRNDQLNRSAFALGQLVADGKLDERTVRLELLAVGTAAGLTTIECIKTIDSGLRGGAQNPRSAA